MANGHLGICHGGCLIVIRGLVFQQQHMPPEVYLTPKCSLVTQQCGLRHSTEAINLLSKTRPIVFTLERILQMYCNGTLRELV